MNDKQRVYIDSDDEARAMGEYREEAEGGMRLVAYLLLGVAMTLGGGALVALMMLAQ